MDLVGSSTQLIATAFTFGLSALAFAYLPFIFTLVNGMLKANSGHNSHSYSVLSVFIMAFIVHFISCVAFMLGIKMLDVLGALYEEDYLQNKIFSIFWTRGENNVFSLVNASGSMEDKGAYLQLYIVQVISDWLMIIGFWVVFFTALSYAFIQTKRDVMQFNLISFLVWLIIANIIGYFVYFLWAKIATLALFIPDSDLISKAIETYQIALN
ncbi:hypothetical protein [Helicobacter sp. MIT 14-3879]|uniref:hypothetical protein n=1 Tax=Helicobacter sp. MIT 14-3879 TaxID=2040649 RepID=UPI000E1E5F92|nr:hypothetical protein [Helicobacter sp. MIT 14-3879]RDU61490.1 hypothetical protein CQA44_08755 [Helicobacter sp. MIT 14-3879]